MQMTPNYLENKLFIGCSSYATESLILCFQWSQDWQIAFNVDKYNVMHIDKKNLQSRYFMDGKELSKVKEEKDLGVYVTSDLSVAVLTYTHIPKKAER